MRSFIRPCTEGKSQETLCISQVIVGHIISEKVRILIQKTGDRMYESGHRSYGMNLDTEGSSQDIFFLLL